VTNAQYPQDYPRQGDDRHPHYYTVLRGDSFDFSTAENTGTVCSGMGTPFERCTFCHGTQNDPVTGIPGTTNPKGTDPTAPFWALAPASMAWESAPGVPMNGAQLCASLLNKDLNGQRTPAQLLEHITNEPLVKWAFAPGIGQNGNPRTTPPILQDELIRSFKFGSERARRARIAEAGTGHAAARRAGSNGGTGCVSSVKATRSAAMIWRQRSSISHQSIRSTR
jgi:hypothetical protein